MLNMNLSLGRILGKTVAVAVSLGLGVALTVFLWGGWDTHAEIEAHNRRARGG